MLLCLLLSRTALLSLMRGLVATELCCTGIRCSLQSTGCMPEAVQISARQAQGLVSNLGPAAPASSHASTKQSAEPSTPVRSGKRPAADSLRQIKG